MHQLVDLELSHAARYLAWPLACSDRPSERFGELWSDAGWQLTKARFSKFEQADDVVRACVALIHVGLHVLEFSVLNNADDAAVLAALLADAIDEVRYTLPEIGLHQWSAVVGKLAGLMAANGLLKSDGCERLLARYDGDDDCLAAAVVNAAANGEPVSEIRRALDSIGVDAEDLRKRWEAWNARIARNERGAPAKFLVHLLAISDPVTKKQ